MRWWERFNRWLDCTDGERPTLAEIEADVERRWAEWDAEHPGVERPPTIPIGEQKT